jgi:malonate decarboxylase beta subunit
MTSDAAPQSGSGRAATARARIVALADPDAIDWLPPAGPSPHLARFGIAPQDDDGIVIARVRLAGEPMLVAAQDRRYLAGSVGERHGNALRAAIADARRERPAAIVLLLASGGVRLHEANAAELALGGALRELLDARVEGICVVAVAVGDVFGGASVVACAADRLALLPSTRIGLSGPRVLESVHGKWELDAEDARDVNAVFGAPARNAMGCADLVSDDADAIRAWICRAARERDDFAASIAAMQARLGRRIAGIPAHAPRFDAIGCFEGAEPVDDGHRIWRRDECWLVGPAPGTPLGPAEIHALDESLLTHVVAQPEPRTVVLVEDSAGHAVSRAVEMRFVSQYLAQHAAVLALLRAQGRTLIGVVTGSGHSAAFFANALQAHRRYALPSARIVAMEASAIARITGLPADELVENDPLLGQPVRHFAAQGGLDAIVADTSLRSLGL